VARFVNYTLKIGWEQSEAEREKEAREACDLHLADLRAHALPPASMPITPRYKRGDRLRDGYDCFLVTISSREGRPLIRLTLHGNSGVEVSLCQLH
jgi:hypothetical protein